MSNIFINRNRSQGAYNVPILKQKFYTTEQSWNNRAQKTKKLETGDDFFKGSLRYKANPDLSPKHVGIGWSLVETSDLVKPSLQNMVDKWNVTQNSNPLHNAYQIHENPKMDYD